MTSSTEATRMTNEMLDALKKASSTMDKVAEDCKVKRGESLFDRVDKCSKRLGQWQDELSDLNSKIQALEKVVKEYDQQAAKLPQVWSSPQSYPAVIRRITELTRDQHTQLKSKLDGYARELNKHKTTLRKIKA
jgi:uncharacterized protein YukE